MRAAFAGVFAVTMLCLLGVGAVLPVLPRYVHGPLGAGDFAVGIVIGAFAFTAFVGRPIAGHLADTRGRRLVVVVGALLAAVAGALYLVPLGVAGLIVARLVLGVGEGMVFTAGAAWVVDLAPAERRGRALGLYGLSVWTGLTLGPPIGELLLRVSSFEVVWLFCAAAPLAAALVAARVPYRYQPDPEQGKRALVAREALGPGLALSLATVGYAAVASFIILHLEARGTGHGAEVFTAFAAAVVATRLVGGNLPDRIGAAPSGLIAAVLEAIGLATIALATAWWTAMAGAVVMGAAFSLLYPSLSLLVVNRVPETRRGVALGTFTAFFDVGVGLGAVMAGAIAAGAGYPAVFWTASALAAGAVVLVMREVRSGRAAG
jgi:MFS family permease